MPSVGTAASGTNTNTATKYLIDTGASFGNTVEAGMIVRNVTDGNYSFVISVKSDTHLLLNHDIFGGTSKSYAVLSRNLIDQIAIGDPAVSMGRNEILINGNKAMTVRGIDNIASGGDRKGVPVRISGSPYLFFSLGTEFRFESIDAIDRYTVD